MRWETWTVFVATETVLCLVPGPAVLLVLSQALLRGGPASLWSSLGILAGNTAYFILSATSLGAILLASYDLFFAVRWIGAGYLVWLGLATFFGKASVLAAAPAPDRQSSRGRMFANGFVLQAANPKALLFFTALLPQFIDPHGPVAMQVAILAATSVGIELVVLGAYGFAAGRASVWAAQPHAARLTNRVAGSLLIVAGAGMALLRRD